MDDVLKRDLERCSRNEHVFKIIYRIPKTMNSFEAVKWCKYCGAVKVDHTIHPVVVKRFPEITKPAFEQIEKERKEQERLKNEKINSKKISSTTSR